MYGQYLYVCTLVCVVNNTQILFLFFTPPSPPFDIPTPTYPPTSPTSPPTSSPTSLLLPFSYGEALQALADSEAWKETVDKELRLVSSVKMCVCCLLKHYALNSNTCITVHHAW